MADPTPTATKVPETQATAAKASKYKKGVYTLISGKHSYKDAEGNRVTARPGDEVPLSDALYEAYQDRFQPIEA